MAFHSPYGTASSSTHHDPHLQFASNNDRPPFADDAQTYWYGSEMDVSSYYSPSRPGSSSSLAGALDEDASQPPRQTAGTLSFPESEVVPVASPLQFSLATPHLQGIEGAPYYLAADFQQYPSVYSPGTQWTDGSTPTDAFSPQGLMHPVSATYDVGSYQPEPEHNYINGQLMQTGIIGNPDPTDTAFLPSPTHSYHASPPRAAVLATSRFPLTPSYTLEGAITPIEPRRPSRPPNNATPQTPPTEAPSSPDAANTDSAAGPAPPRPKRQQTSLSATSLHTPTPPPAATPAGLFSQFSSKQTFRHTLVASPGSTGDRSDGEGVIGSLVEDVKGPVRPPPTKKKPAMACLFCRERKICCGPPAPDSTDQRCKQCVKRDQSCVFPTECRRGQHKRVPRKSAPAPPDGDGAPPPAPGESATSVKPKATTQKERAALSPKRARSSDAKARATGQRAASLVRVKPHDVGGGAGTP